jgi:hypothetical protein
MRVPEVRAAILVAAAVVLFGGCSSASGPAGSDAGPSNARGPSAGGAASDATGAGSASAPSAGGDPTTNACGLLTAEEIQQATGIAVGPGTLQNSDNQSDCEWAGTQSDTQSVGLTVSMYDDSLWQTASSATSSTPVSGIGDAAFKGWPLSSDLTIKVKGYQVVLAIIDFQATKDAIDAADLAMAKLVLTRL